MATNELHEELSAQQRLAISRRALMRHLRGEDETGAADRPSAASFAADHKAGSSGQGKLFGLLQRPPYGAMLLSLTERWWSRHPVNAGVQLARPILDRVARERPVQLMATAAAVGALVVLVKPWKLLSITAMLAAAFKTSDVADLVTTLMQPNAGSRQ